MFYIQIWLYYAVWRINRTCFIIPFIIRNTCQYYNTELHEPLKGGTRWIIQ